MKNFWTLFVNLWTAKVSLEREELFQEPDGRLVTYNNWHRDKRCVRIGCGHNLEEHILVQHIPTRMPDILKLPRPVLCLSYKCECPGFLDKDKL